MDVAEFRTLAESLLDRLGARLDETQASIVREYLQVGEWHEAVDNLVATVAADDVRITEPEREDLRQLAESLTMPADVLARVSVAKAVDEPGPASGR